MKKILAIALVLLAVCAVAAGARDVSEERKIDFLISSVENLSGVTFIRNGTAYDGKEAAKHLRMKLRIAGSRVRSAEDFITFCASGSSASAKPYLIRFPDGKQMRSEDFFRARLREFSLSNPPQQLLTR